MVSGERLKSQNLIQTVLKTVSGTIYLCKHNHLHKMLLLQILIYMAVQQIYGYRIP